MTADLDTRRGELYALGGELLPAGQGGSDDAGEAGGASGRSPSDPSMPDAFASSREQFESLVSFLMGRTLPGSRTRSLRSVWTATGGSCCGG